MSVSRITKELDYSVKFLPDSCIFQNLSSGKVLATGKEKDGLYFLEHKVKVQHHAKPINGLIAIKK